MSSSDKDPLSRPKAIAWGLLLIAGLLWLAVWLVSQVWVWLLVVAVIAAAIWLLVWWRRRRW